MGQYDTQEDRCEDGGGDEGEKENSVQILATWS